MSIGHLKYNPSDKYCNIWRDTEYRKDLRKDHCENIDCKNDYKRLDNHHAYLDKKRCAPNDVITLCNSCHMALHRLLEMGKRNSANPKDFIIIVRPDHVSYIHKKTHKIIRIKRE